MMKNLPPEEIGSMMGFMRQAVKDTYFEKWLQSGGFTWDGVHNSNNNNNNSSSSNSVSATVAVNESTQNEQVVNRKRPAAFESTGSSSHKRHQVWLSESRILEAVSPACTLTTDLLQNPAFVRCSMFQLSSAQSEMCE